MKVWLITGCSGGFGKILAHRALARGDRVVVTARNLDSLGEFTAQYPQTARAVELDVTRAGDAQRAVSFAEKEFGRLDVLVNNAGHGMIGAIEEGTPAEYRPLFETNVFGLIEMTRAALPLLRRQRGGRVVNLSSGAGLRGTAGHGYYNATKFAVEGLSDALSAELAPLGIAVIVVEPGPFRTEFLGRSMTVARNVIDDYAVSAGGARTYRATNDGRQLGDPEKGVALMMKAIDSESPPLRLPLSARVIELAHAKFAAFGEAVAIWKEDIVSTGFQD
jgi:NAD(P)-dependent dehydrogenase (short-subunit alcohol dehydrogenase family)